MFSNRLACGLRRYVGKTHYVWRALSEITCKRCKRAAKKWLYVSRRDLA